MNWTCEFSTDAGDDLRPLSKAVQRGVARVLAQMETNPFQADVKPLEEEEWKGVYRRRMGGYRLLFTADHSAGIVFIVRILIQSGKTYQ